MCDKNKAGIPQSAPVFVQEKKKNENLCRTLVMVDSSGMSNEGLTFQEGRDGIVILEVLHV